MEYVVKNQPLVSIIIVTFNSARYVEETLESCKAQTYKNIELIVTDDCSTDNTVKVCKKWIEKNRERFSKIKVVTTPQNSGISSNFNRGFKAASGEWLKFIAGDDALLPNCIKDNIDFTVQNPNAQVIHSKRLDYNEAFVESNFLQEFPSDSNYFMSPNISASKQLKILLRKCCVSAPTAFIKKTLLEKLNGFDERVPMVEDWPLWLKATSAGYKIFFLNKPTVKYRFHTTSASSSMDRVKLFTPHNQRMQEIHRYYIYPHLPLLEKLLYGYNFRRMKLFNTLGINRYTSALRFLDKFTGFPANKYRNLKYKMLTSSRR